MVVLAAAVLSKSGKVLFSRQYVDMTRLRIEGILAAFPKLIESGSEGVGKQHTYVETGSIRYVYQPIEGLYLVLVTTRGSNIVEDLDTLRLLSKVIPEYSMVTEDEVTSNVFDLIFAFDEVLLLGYKDNITLDGIRTNLEMDSHNEKLHIMVTMSKINEAKDEAKRKAASIKAMKATAPMPGIGPSTGIGPSSGGGISSSDVNDGIGSFNSSSSPSAAAASRPDSGSMYGSKAESSVPSSTGMKLGKGLKLGSKGGKGLSALQQMAKEEGIDANALVQQQSAKVNTSAPGAVVRTDPVEVRITETVSVIYDRDSAVNKVEIKGVITLTCHEDDSKIKLQLENYGDVAPFQFTPHPNLSKPDFLKSNLLKLKTDKPFPKDKPLGILKWRYLSKDDESMVPLKITCWPESNGDGTMNVNMELELLCPHISLRDVLVAIPLNTSEEPEVLSIEGGVHRHNARKHQIEWEVTTMDKDSTVANLEFTVAGREESDFFPVNVTFTSEDTMCPVHLASVESVETSEPTKFGLYRQLQADTYQVQFETD
mmetsp:Transcript_2751/g.5317  ORF Transcript_2751/g.5317 Transcript_2751/m.5317 type:complete len:541 (-) Transcript_2751:34-1656(-)